MKHTIVLLILVTLFSSCKKEKATSLLCLEPSVDQNSCIFDSNQLKAAIVGRWNWTQTRTVTFLPLTKNNPCTDNIAVTYQFNNNGTFNYYENEIYLGTGNYYIGVRDNVTYFGMSGSGFTFPHLAGITGLCNNYLVFDNSDVDGPITTLVKEN
jgi:hypothetical protein